VNCLKCGREIEEGQVFCSSCLDVMQKYPVKQGIAILLPHRKDLPVQKKSHLRRRQPVTPEEQILRLKRRLSRVVVLWLVTLLLLAATIYPTVEFFLGKSFHRTGQNYTAIVNEDSTSP